ncbi:helix-turn-helix domain-containing protein [Cognatiyoonia sp. IB215182]|uniref:TetR/AcrR family transcriptional regulator n=1 Tax=Cognatiyoonia sp. IB215182 TaxID=3097353 RepID=UPI002A0B1740|nr:helix-turn-helix domain-containing protein [Cognatiyoonia sp. IB215182]MDX8355806.1 helix-turn-helix domain-containing protein [Cognatiyoonia sp. IB215182]
MPRETRTAKSRILDAANRLFYSEGIRAVSIDAIAEKAGVTKMTVYYHFDSKDDLIAAYLDSRDQPNITLYKTWFEEAKGPLDKRIEAIFINLARSARHPKWKGCGFLRTAAELTNMPGHPAMKVGAAHKKRFEAWLSDMFGEHGKEQPEELARQVVLLMDGAFSTVLVHRDPEYLEAAGRAARAAVSNAP